MSDTEPTPTTAQPFDVGARLFALRQERGRSQRELARLAGVTNANLSMIEQGRVSPSINTLEKILLALGLTLPEFFAGSDAAAAEIFPRERLVHLTRDGSEYRILPPPVNNPTPYLAQQTLAAGTATAGSWLGRRAWISGMVQVGELNLWLDGQRHELRPGDGFRFHLKRPHSFANDTQDPVVVILTLSGADDTT